MPTSTVSAIALKYLHFHAPDWMAFDNIEDAIAAAFWMIEDNNGLPVEVVSLEGVVLLNEQQLSAKVEAYSNQRSSPVHVALPSISASDLPAAEAFSNFMGRRDAHAQDWFDLPDQLKDVWRAKVAGHGMQSTRDAG